MEPAVQPNAEHAQVESLLATQGSTSTPTFSHEFLQAQSKVAAHIKELHTLRLVHPHIGRTYGAMHDFQNTWCKVRAQLAKLGADWKAPVSSENHDYLQQPHASSNVSVSNEQLRGEVYGLSWESFISIELDFRKHAGKTFRETANITNLRGVRRLQTLFRQLQEHARRVCGRPGLSNLPQHLRRMIFRLALGWWVRHRQKSQGKAILCPHKWHSDTDVISCESFADIPACFVVVYKIDHVTGQQLHEPSDDPNSNTHHTKPVSLQTRISRVEQAYAKRTRHWYAFDVRELTKMLIHAAKNGSHRSLAIRNPYTNEPFDIRFMMMVMERGKALALQGHHDGQSAAGGWAGVSNGSVNGDGHSSSATPSASAPEPVSGSSTALPLLPSVTPDMAQGMIRQLRLSVVEGFMSLSYIVTYGMLAELTCMQLAQWYHECYDIWHYRAQLTTLQHNQIVPLESGAPVFPRHRRIQPATWQMRHTTVELQYIVWTTMHQLVTSASQTQDREMGANYALIALTICSGVFREAFPMLTYAVQ